MGKKILSSCLGGLGILLLIIDSKTALTGASSGIELCLSSLIPSVFPFLVLTGMLTPAICSANLPLLRPFSRILGIPPGSEGIFLTGIVSGYPAGAQVIHQAWKAGQLKTADARRMLAFCCNAGPSFIFGILSTRFPSSWMVWLLWGIHILSAIVVAVILPGKNRQPALQSRSITVSLPQALKKAVINMAYICGWVVLFRIVIAFFDCWFLWVFPGNIRIAFCGLLELANGCCIIENLTSVGLRFILCSGMLAFGGLCVTMQTVSVTEKLGLGQYLQGKILQTIISIMLSMTAQHFLFSNTERISISPVMFGILTFSLPIFATISLKYKNRGRILSSVGV